MFIELSLYDGTYTSDAIIQLLFKSLDAELNGLSVGPVFLSSVRQLIPKSVGFGLSCPVDLGFGYMDSSLRNHAVISAIRRGATNIDLTASSRFLAEEDYHNLYHETKSNFDICLDNKVDMRIQVDYMQFSETVITRLAELSMNLGITTIVIGTLEKVNDIVDNVILCRFLKERTGINTILTCNPWLQKDLSMITASEIYGIKIGEFSFLSLFRKTK